MGGILIDRGEMVMDIKTEITKYLGECHLPKSKGIQLTENTLLLEEKVLDSLGMLELISFVEETFRMEVPDEDIIPDHFGTIEQLALYVESHVMGNESNL
jgi:acyl carrier protein